MAEYDFEEGIIEKNINMDLMTDDELHMKLEKGYNDIDKGRLQDAKRVFEEFRERHLRITMGR